MCGIVGLKGEFKADTILSMMKITESRGMDSHGIYLKNEENIIYNNNFKLSDFNVDKNTYNIGIGHNLLSIFNFYNEDEFLNFQPIKYNNLILSFNGEIYNYKEVLNFLKSNLYDGQSPKSDSELLVKLLYYYYNKDYNLLDAVEHTNRIIDGDYAYSVFDGVNIAVTRDKIGVKPLFYGEYNGLQAFASEKKALWKINIKDKIKSLKPGFILYNFREYPPKDLIYGYVSSQHHKYETYKKKLDTLLNKSVKDRIKNVDDIALIFSGGVDSTLLLYYILDNLNEKQNLTLYTVSNNDSQDLKHACKVAKSLNQKLKVSLIDEDTVRHYLDKTLLAIEEANLMKLGVGMTIFIASHMIFEDNIKVALSGQGADELFAGYNRYRNTYELGYTGKDGLKYKRFKAVECELRHDIENIYDVNLQRDDAVSMANGVELRVPFLSEELVKWSLNIPAKYKIKNAEDNIRKNILRDLASDKGIPDYIAYRNKKAAQYGSGIDKILRKKIFKDLDINQYYNKLIETI
ncbi:asparagine synthetase B [uncultured Methanobrevibacter sp.]|uniref:asparagine synthetase B n=1 Tax=uncultured Methanobrevibacter sp. TaxID=253161 RepID=UPI0025DFF3EA|nr:asparagine synthetase B [uncultured Methanobrevibacter sp.]